MRSWAAALLMAVLPIATLSACGGSGADDVTGITVLAASSLTDVLPELAAAYTAQTGTGVTAVYGGSNHLAAQIRDGAPANAFLTADPRLLDGMATAAPASDFASNRLVVAVPAGNPAGVTGRGDLARPDLRVVVCDEAVPCGRATAGMGVDIRADSMEASVRAVLSRLVLGEADVGVVYATDVASAPRVEEAWPQSDDCPCVTYSAAATTARALPFLAFLGSARAREILAGHGFATGGTG